MSDVTPDIQQAEAQVAQAQAELQAAEAAETAAEAKVHVSLARPFFQWQPPAPLPLITWDGSEVSASVAEELQAAAQAAGIELAVN
jgi:multidrug resistance efflux pump